MKKLTVILFSLFYLLVSAGVLVNMHYCHGELASVKVFSDKGSCGCSINMDADSCCKNESFIIRLKDDQQRSQTVISTPELNSTGLIRLLDFLIDFTSIKYENPFGNIDLPPPERPPVWILNCSLTYYG